MMKLAQKPFSLLTLLLAATLLPGWAPAESTFSKLCIFGDSLSDTGNLFEIEH